MNNCTLLPPGQILSFGAEAADRLLTQDHGDAALLYFHLLRHGTPFPPHWDMPRIRHGQAVLSSMGLLPSALLETSATETSPIPKEISVIPPEYTTEDLNIVLGEENGKGEFRQLVETVEEQFGKSLTTVDLKLLLEIYDHLELPVPVILMVVTTCIRRQEMAKTSRRRPNMKEIQKEAQYWQHRGIITLDAAMAYTEELSQMDHQQATIVQLFHLDRNHITNTERDYIKQWNDWGFPLESYPLAYERCLTGEKNHSFKWSYTNGIFKKWHQRNLHSPQEILAADGQFDQTQRPGELRRSPKAVHAQATIRLQEDSAPTPEQAKRMEENLQAMKRMTDLF